MLKLILTVAALAIAAPAAAIIAKPRLPAPTPGVDYVETRCLNGGYGGDILMRVQADGLVLRTAWQPYGVFTTRATAVEAVKVVDRAQFGARPDRPATRAVCWLIRVRAGRMATIWVPNEGGSAQDAELRRVIASVKALGLRAKTPYAWPTYERGK